MERFGARAAARVMAALLLGGAAALPAAAQDEGAPHLPGAPQSHLPPAPQGLPSGPIGILAEQDLLVTSSANDHGTYLWIVGPSQHIVILCEKTDPAKDFTCTTKRLP